MSALSEKIAAEHAPMDASRSHCACGFYRPGDAYTAHVAEATEAAVRERVAEDIVAWRQAIPGYSVAECSAFNAAARIARGELR